MKYLTMLMLVFLLVACTDKNQKPAAPVEAVVVDKSVPYICGEPPAVDPFKAKAVKFGTIDNAGQRLFTLTPPAYEALMTNMSKVATSTAQVVKQRDFYKDCIERSQEKAQPARSVIKEVRPAGGNGTAVPSPGTTRVKVEPG